MTKINKKIPPVVRLNYSKGDLIIKEGDYGISIYEIISGKVGIFVESGGREVQTATLGRGMIVGETSFVLGNTNPRSASARALEDCSLEAWHPAMLSNDYNKMPTTLRLVTDQALRFLVRMNKIASGLSLVQEQTKDDKTKKPSETFEHQRKTYRKKVNIECIFRPVNSPENIKLLGEIRDISRGGLQMAVRMSVSQECSLVVGEEFFITMVLPPDQKVDATAKINWQKQEEKTGTIYLGMVFTQMGPEDQRKLGFYLMP